jgi:hypothetical protein
MSEQRKRATAAELDQVLDTLIQAIPPERYGEMRAILREALVRATHKAALARLPAPAPDDAAPDDGETASHPSPAAPGPAMTPERAARITATLAAMRAAGSPPTTALARRDGPGPRRVAVGGASMQSGAGSQEPKGPRLAVRVGRDPLGHAVRLSDVTPETLRWLWPGRIPAGKITLLDGDPGLGKSTLLCELAARISRGEPLPGDGSAPANPRGVLLFSAEDDVFDTIRPRIDAAGGDPGRIVAVIAIPNGTDSGRPFALPHDLPILEAIVHRLDAALVVIDPLVAFLRPGVSATSDQHVRHALGALKASAERTGAAIVGVRHLTKSGSANPLYRGLGSIGLLGAARSGLVLAADPDDAERRILAVGKRNLARSAASLAFRLEEVPGSSVTRLVWDGESSWTATQLLQVQGQTEEDGDTRRSVVDEARTWLREALAAGPRSAQELRSDASTHGISEKTLYAARRAEGVTVSKERVPNGRWFWMLEPSPSEREESALPSP